jgi:hypothetical protein
MGILESKKAKNKFFEIEILVDEFFVTDKDYGVIQYYTNKILSIEKFFDEIKALNIDYSINNHFIQMITNIQDYAKERFDKTIDYIIKHKYDRVGGDPDRLVYYTYRIVFSEHCDHLFNAIRGFGKHLDVSINLPTLNEIESDYLPFTQETFDLGHFNLLDISNIRDISNIMAAIKLGQRLEAVEFEEDEITEIPQSMIIRQSAPQPAMYCILTEKITDLHKMFIEKNIIEQMDCADFMKCFDLNNEPTKKPKYVHQNTMVYALSLIKNSNNKNVINQKIAWDNFGIKNYDAVKSNVKNKYPIEPSLGRKIRNALKVDDMNYNY